MAKVSFYDLAKKMEADKKAGKPTPKRPKYDDHCPGCPYSCGDVCVDKRRDLHPELKKENTQAVIDHITDIMDAIYDYPEYGKVWYNSEKSEIVVSIGDGFENEESLEKALKKIPGIKDVDIDAEIPAPNAPGYVLVYPKNHKTIGDLIKGD